MLANLRADDLVHELASRGVRVTRDGNELLILGTIARLTSRDVDTLRNRKADLLAYLGEEDEIDYCPDGKLRPSVKVIVDPRTGGIGAASPEPLGEYIAPHCDFWAWEGNPFVQEAKAALVDPPGGAFRQFRQFRQRGQEKEK